MYYLQGEDIFPCRSFLPSLNITILFLVPSLLVAGLCAETIYTWRSMTRSRKSLRNPYLFLPLVGHRFVCSNIMLQACHDEISDINLIRKCKCKNFVTGLLAHSVLKSTQMAASLTGLHYHLHFRKISLCTTYSNYQFLAASQAVYAIFNLETLMQTLYFVDKKIIQF